MTDYICPSCFKSSETDLDYQTRLVRYLAGLPSEIKALPDEYRRRLSICAQCDELVGITCGLCGCYVEMRAAKSGLACPQKGEGW